MNKMINLFAITLLTMCSSHHQQTGSWAVKMADAVISRYDSLAYYDPEDKASDRSTKKIKWQYDVAMLGQAIDKLGYIDSSYSLYHKSYIDYFIDDEGNIKKYKLEDYNLDNVNPAKGLITLYKRTGDEKYLKAVNRIINQISNQPKTNSGGFWHKKIYPWQMWLDGVYMSSPFIAQYAYEFNKPEWFDSVAFQIKHIYSKTLDPESGLLYHAWDESKSQAWCNKETGQSKEFWGRSIGWYLMAIVDVLDYFPDDNANKDSIIDILNHVSKSLLNVRDPGTGLWYQVLNKPDGENNYIEASCSAMFTYAFAKGSKRGYLPKEYYEVAEKSFASIVENLIKTDKNNLPVLINTCGSAGLGGNPYRDGTYTYYVNERKVDNDPKGVGPFILAAIELNK